MAILYRTNAQSQALEDALRRDNLPYNIVSGVSFYKRKEVKDTIAYLRLLVNPDDSESLLRVINEPTRGIGQTSLKRISEYANTEGVSLWDVLKSVKSVPNIQTRTINAIEQFVDIIERHQATLHDLPPATLAQQYIEATGLPGMYKQQDTEESLDRWNNIERVLDHILEQQELDEDLTMAGYLEQVALVSEQDDPKLGTDRISMMTMHAAKGLEFPLVVIAGLEQGLFPLSKAETDPSEQEEERRLFYVGITRAREQLILAYAERRYRFGELVFSRPSMFLSEIDSDAFAPSARTMARSGASTGGQGERATRRSGQGANRGRSTGESRRTNNDKRERDASGIPMAPRAPKPENEYSQLPDGDSYSQTEEGGLQVGTRVKHPIFGAGTIKVLGGSGQNAKAKVQFDNGQTKQLMLAYARLEVL